MSIPTIPPYVPSFKPVPTVTPFTYRDGTTMLKKLDNMVRYINIVIIPFINNNFEALADEVEADINNMIELVNEAIDEVINSGVTIQDPIVAQIFQNPSSETRVITDALYASLAEFNTIKDTVNTGRLSQTELDDRYALADALDTAVTNLTNTINALKTLLISSTGLNVLDFGAKGDGVTNDTVAIQNAINAAAPGQAVIFPHTGSGAFYLITSTLLVTTPSIRFLGQPRDAYAVSIRTNVASMLMVSVKTTGFVMENLGLIGKTDLGTGGNTNGATCTAVGIELFGDTDGNVDSAVRGCTFQFLYTAIVLHGRNAEITNNTIVSNCRNGIKHNGIDIAYHTGPNATQNRGTIIANCRFHNIGTVNTDLAIEFTANSRVLHLIIDGNHFDSEGFGAHISISGDSVNPARGVSIINNKHTELAAEAIKLYWTQYTLISNTVMMGNAAIVSPTTADAIYLENTLYLTIANFVMRFVARHGINGISNTGMSITAGRIIQVGQSTTDVGSAINLDSTNTDILVENVHGATGDGYFFNGSPTGKSFLRNCTYSSYTAGNINSNNLYNDGRRGATAFTEGKLGSVEEIGIAQYTLVAATLKKVATVQIGANFGAFILSLDIAGRNGTTGNAYFVGKRIIRNENGTPNVVTVGTDTNVGLTVAIASTGPQTFDINVTSAEAALIGVKVIATSAGGSSGSTQLPLTVTMQ